MKEVDEGRGKNKSTRLGMTSACLGETKELCQGFSKMKMLGYFDT